MARRFNPYLIDRSADYLSNSIQGAVTAFDTQMANIEKSKNELALQDAELKRISSSLSADDEQNFKDDLTDAVNAEIDRIYKLGYNSIGRDQTEYLKAQSNLINGVKDLQAGLAIFDEEGKEYQKIVESGQGQFKISNSTDPKARDFMNNISLNKGNGTKIGYENGNFTLNYNGYSKNISNYFQARKNGAAGTINYVGDPSAEYKAIYDKYASNYEPKLIKIQTEAADGTVTTTTRKNYDLARKKIREDLYNDPNLLTSISGDEYQYLSQFSNDIDPNEPFKGTPDQIKKALDAKVDLIMDQYAKENQTTLFMQQQDASDAKKGDYTRIFRDEANTALDILQSDSPLDSYAQYLRDQNPGKADVYQVKGDTLYRTDIKGNPPEQFETPIITIDALEATNANLDKLIIQINENKPKDLMIPQVRMTEYLNTLDVDLDTNAEDIDPIGLRNQKVKPEKASGLAKDAIEKAFDLYKTEIGDPNLVFTNLSEDEKKELIKNPIFREKLREVRAEQNKSLNKNQGNPR